MTAALTMNLPTTPIVSVHTTSNRGFTPEEVAARCVDKLIYVSSEAPPVIRDQALAYKEQIAQVVARYMHEAIANDRAALYSALTDAGHPDLADLIRRL